jgi:hypothetical protein
MGFQQQVNIQPAPAVAGDFASANPRANVLAGPGGLIVGSNTPVGLTQAGVLVGRFAWTSPGTALNVNSGETDGAVYVNSNGAGAPAGFVHREQQALITVFLAQATNLVPVGLPITLHNEGDFWAVNASAAASAIGQTIYAINATGAAWPAVAGTPPTDATLTTITVVANTANVSAAAVNAFSSAYISGTTLTITTVTTGGLFLNQAISGTGVAAGTLIVSQLTGTAGSTGTYTVNINQTAGTVGSPIAMTGSGGWWTVTSMTNGAVYVGQTWSGGTNAFAAGTTILAGGTGVGGAGTYPLSISQTKASTATATGLAAYMNVTAVTGTINVGDTIVTNGHTGTVLAQVSGTTGGIGAYLVSNQAAVGDTSGTINSGTATKWTCQSVAAPGELMKISTWPLG